MENWPQVFARMGAIWEYRDGGPHAQYEMADTHTNFYFNTDIIVSEPEFLRSLFKSAFLPDYAEKPDWIVSYNSTISAGIVMATVLAEELKTKIAYINLDSGMTSVPIEAGALVQVVVDDIPSGKSLARALAVLRKYEVKFARPIFTLANFSGRKTFDDIPVLALYERSVQKWSAVDCPLCKAGSSPLPARRAWKELTTTKID